MTERRQARDEGAEQTRQIIEAVTRLRKAKGWSAQQLAEQMTSVGIPWNADIVVNLEHGRRKSLRVHELLALAWVLQAPSPVDLLAPEGDDSLMWVTPEHEVPAGAVREWFMGEIGPLRRYVGAVERGHEVGQKLGAVLREIFEDLLRKGYEPEEARSVFRDLLRDEGLLRVESPLDDEGASDGQG